MLRPLAGSMLPDSISPMYLMIARVPCEWDAAQVGFHLDGGQGVGRVLRHVGGLQDPLPKKVYRSSAVTVMVAGSALGSDWRVHGRLAPYDTPASTCWSKCR